jgi:hypothetical protein
VFGFKRQIITISSTPTLNQDKPSKITFPRSLIALILLTSANILKVGKLTLRKIVANLSGRSNYILVGVGKRAPLQGH